MSVTRQLDLIDFNKNTMKVNGVQLSAVKLFQTGMNFFLLLNTK